MNTHPSEKLPTGKVVQWYLLLEVAPLHCQRARPSRGLAGYCVGQPSGRLRIQPSDSLVQNRGHSGTSQYGLLCDDHCETRRTPNFCCSSACFPMCSWTEDTALLTEGDTPAPPHPAPTPAAPSRGPQLRSSRSSSGPASSSPSGSGPAVRQCRGSPRRGRPLCSNPPPGGRDGLQVGDWEEARSGPSP